MSSWRNSNPLHQQHQQQQQQAVPQQQAAPQQQQQQRHFPSLIHQQSMPPSSVTPSGQSSNNTMENGPRAKCDQVVFEAIAKAAEIVVGSRCWIDNHTPPNTNSGGSSSSSRGRFNLLVPEVQGVRTILQRWKRALHVPLRLDVYYQHPDSRRELLERWCLEYAPKPGTGGGSGAFMQQPTLASTSTDPIVQLRQVCKQIVIWLRSVYCWSRMLPAQALRSQNTNNSAIGFSIYVVSEGNDDVSGLVSQQGFLSQAQPHSVWTPYGELGWRVFYAPKSFVQRLIPERKPYNTSMNTAATSRPIPMNPQQQQHQAISQVQPQSYRPVNREMVRRDATPPSTVQSAPHNTGRIYHRSKSDVSDAQHRAMSVATAATGIPGGVYRNQPITGHQIQPGQQLEHGMVTAAPLSTSADSKPLTQNRSALSLAMMTMENDETKDVGANTAANNEAAEKRRAALHHAPPQLPPSPILKKSPLGTAGEYGYAYNNQIPSLRTTKSNTPPTPNGFGSPIVQFNAGVPSNSYSTTPTPLGSTPPAGYLLGGPTPPSVVSHLSNLIPPRGAVTPPFTRPMGFVGQPPSQDEDRLLPSAASLASPQQTQNNAAGIMASQNQQQQHSVAPPTSLDMLHSSPFQQPAYGSIFGGGGSSSAADGGPFGMLMGNGFGAAGNATPGSELMMMYGGSSTGGGMSAAGGVRLQPALDDLDDVMPFAVDPGEEGFGSTAQDGGTGASSSLAMGSLTSSIMMRDMSHPPKRLQLFKSIGAPSMSIAGGISEYEDGNSTTTDNALNSLADQLAEFKTFGASLMASGAAASVGRGSVSDGDASASTSTPITLRS